MHHPTDRIAHTTAFVTPVVEHWLEREIAQWVHPMKDRTDDPSHHERTLLPQSYISLLFCLISDTGGISHVYIKDNQFLHLTCCTPAYDVITWEKYNSTSNTWLAFPWFEPCPHCPGVPSREICDAGQAYVVRSTRKWDAGVYRCVVTGDESVTSRRFSVEYIRKLF